MKITIYTYRDDQSFASNEYVCKGDSIESALEEIDFDRCTHVKVLVEVDGKMSIYNKSVESGDPAATVVSAIEAATALCRGTSGV